MQFITTGNRIAVENFTLGDLYTITFTNGTYINSACIGIGENFVSFQRNEPELIFSLTMETAELVSSIDLYAGGTGTNNYNDLTNKPQINDVELVGNKSLSDFGIQPTISDIDTIRSGAAAGATAVQPAALADYQPKIDSSHKLDADLVDDTSSANKFATAAQLSQIGINENNISLLTNKTNEIGIVKTIVPITPSAANVYECITASKITLPAGKILRITASCIFQNSYATGIAIVRGTTKENNKILAISESATDYNALSVSTVCSFGSDQDLYVFLQTNTTGTTKVVMAYDIISP